MLQLVIVTRRRRILLPVAVDADRNNREEDHAANGATNDDAKHAFSGLNWANYVIGVLRSRQAVIGQVCIVVHLGAGDFLAAVGIDFVCIILVVVLVEDNVTEVCSWTEWSNTHVEMVHIHGILFVWLQTESSVVFFKEWRSEVVNIIGGGIGWQFPHANITLS